MRNPYRKFLLQHLDIRSKTGFEWQAICPFHEDTSPSFSVNIQKGLFICYACGEKGNMKKLAEHLQAGMPDAPQATLEEVTESLSKLKEELLQTERPAVGIKIPSRFLDSSQIYDYWYGKRKLGMLTSSRFRLGFDDIENEAIIPLADLHGRVLGLIRRRMGNEMPRYMYPRGLKIGNCLFGADIAKQEYEMFEMAKREKKTFTSPAIITNGNITEAYSNYSAPPLVIVEGSVDAMSVYQDGGLAVALLGSRMSIHQAELIKKIAPPHIVIATDRDRAGREAEIQVMTTLKNERLGIPISIAKWDSSIGKDLAELTSWERIQAIKNSYEDYEHSTLAMRKLRFNELKESV